MLRVRKRKERRKQKRDLVHEELQSVEAMITHPVPGVLVDPIAFEDSSQAALLHGDTAFHSVAMAPDPGRTHRETSRSQWNTAYM